MNLLLEGYSQFCNFDESTLGLVEYLRFMRILYFLSWCESQKNDPGFCTRYPDWGTRSFWVKELEDLRYQARQTN
jgi:Ser/Thr protein kinase RdoA (MazF antagonist)